MFKKLFFTTLALLFVNQSSLAKFSQNASPGLLITPTRVLIEGKSRSQALSLVNNGAIAGRYKMSIINKAMKEDGSIIEITEENVKDFPNEMTADKMIRISPRRVSLRAGEYQNIRVLARKPKDLPDGEYRSHLRFSIIPDATLSEREENAKNQQNIEEDTLSISIKANFGIVIPVIIRHGNVSAIGELSKVKISKNEDGKHLIDFDINRKGNASLYGDIEIKHKSPSGKETILQNVGGIAVYYPLEKRKISFQLDIPSDVDITKGSINVTYKEKEKEKGKLIAEQTTILN